MSPGALLLPLGAGFGYACGAIAIKRSLSSGISGSWVNVICNAVMALFFQWLWLLPGGVISPRLLLAPAICGFLFFLGQICTFRAIATGDVSVSTPLLGTKVVLVTLFSVFLMGKPLPVSWWGASVLATLGIAMISYTPGGSHRHLAQAVAWSLAAAALFALTDVLVQGWVPRVGYSRFAPVMFGVMGICSLLHLPVLLHAVRKQPRSNGVAVAPGAALLWLFAGALLLAVQALGMYSAIGLYGSAAFTNILYGSRCLWSVLLVWLFASLVPDHAVGGDRSAVMLRRLIGALLLLSAMALVLR
ncbi:MAG: EamA family transporter [Chthoniobacterales bacterium]